MNSLSLFIYAAQVTGAMREFFIIGGAIGLIALCASQGVPRFYNTVEELSVHDSRYWTPPTFRTKYVAMIAAAFVIGNLIPSRDTMYAIAASQMGEQIVKSEVASDATKALHQWIKKQIEPEKKQ